MKMTLSDIKGMYKKYDCLETESNYLVKRFGKYEPDMIFVISKKMEMEVNDNGKIIDPLEFTDLYNSTLENMNILFNGRVDALIGKFWISKNGNKCFSPYEIEEIKDVAHFCHKASNGGGTGYDYWVVPKKFKNVIGDDEY